MCKTINYSSNVLEEAVGCLVKDQLWIVVDQYFQLHVLSSVKVRLELYDVIMIAMMVLGPYVKWMRSTYDLTLFSQWIWDLTSPSALLKG